jgi:flagellum-specific ATP synthase
MSTLFAQPMQTLEGLHTAELSGRVSQVQGLTLKVADLLLPVGAMVRIEGVGGEVEGEVVGFDADEAIVMLLGDTRGLRRGDRVIGTHTAPMAKVGNGLIGRVLDGMGRPIDGKGPLLDATHRPLNPKPVDAMRRTPIDAPLGTGVRALDTMTTVGLGQRLGVFAGPGVGKSTILSMIAKQTQAAVSVIALIGERGREVQEFVQRSLGEEGLARSVVVVATSDEPALMRIRAAMYATAVAEHFRDQGLDAVLLMDSVTRFCQAQRQVGLAAGEPPATKGYTPSVFTMLPQLLERSGRTENGSITGFYSILVEGDDLTEPISDACRGILDGHVVLSRDLANKGHWPAIDVLDSISRVALDVTDVSHQTAQSEINRLMSLYHDVEDLVNIGAYSTGANPEYDLAIEAKPIIDQLLRQSSEEHVTFEQSRQMLIQVYNMIQQHAQKLARGPAQPAGPAG